MHEKFIDWTIGLRPKWVGTVVYVSTMFVLVIGLIFGWTILEILTNGASVLVIIIVLMMIMAYAFYIAIFKQGKQK